LICGESYLGAAPPDRCPFCGADRRHLVAAAEWIHYGPQELTAQSRNDVVQALQLELNNTSFYQCARHKAQNEISEAIFARLAKQESEHAELLAEMLGIDPLQAANEGKIVAIVAKELAGKALDLLDDCALARGASVIGRISSTSAGRVIMTTRIGGTRVLAEPTGELLPRIC